MMKRRRNAWRHDLAKAPSKAQSRFMHQAHGAPKPTPDETKPNFFDELYRDWQNSQDGPEKIPRGPRTKAHGTAKS